MESVRLKINELDVGVALERLRAVAEFMCNLFQGEKERLETLMENQINCRT